MRTKLAWTFISILLVSLLVLSACQTGVGDDRAALGLIRWNGRPLLERVLAQLARELLILQASDWQFLITTQAARDYAELLARKPFKPLAEVK